MSDPYAMDRETEEILRVIYREYDIPGIRERSCKGDLSVAENALAVLVGNVEVMLQEHRGLVWQAWRRWAYRLRAWGRGDTYIRFYPNPGIGIGLGTYRLALSILGGVRILRHASH